MQVRRWNPRCVKVPVYQLAGVVGVAEADGDGLSAGEDAADVFF